MSRKRGNRAAPPEPQSEALAQTTEAKPVAVDPHDADIAIDHSIPAYVPPEVVTVKTA